MTALAIQNATMGARISGISASFAAGTITAICGPNGAGKSTLLTALAGLLPLDAGAVMLGDAPLSRLSASERARAIGYLPQSGEVAWNLSVAALAGLGRLPHSDQRAEPVTAALEALDLGHLAQRPVASLSGGELARALLARVLAGEPRWILADEPLAALDLAHQRELLAHLRRTADTGTGVVLVLHDLATAMNHADQVLVLQGGLCVTSGPPEHTLTEDVIAKVWQVPARWLGEPGARALSIPD